MDTPIFDSIFGNGNANPANPVGGSYSRVSDFLGIALNLLMGLSFGASLIAILMAGVQFTMSEGDAKGIQTAKKYLTMAVFAVLLSLMGFAIKRALLAAANVSENNLIQNRPNL